MSLAVLCMALALDLEKGLAAAGMLGFDSGAGEAVIGLLDRDLFVCASSRFEATTGEIPSNILCKLVISLEGGAFLTTFMA